MIYFGDVVKMKKFFNFIFGKHCFIGQNQVVTFYINKLTEEKAEKFGAIKYKDSKFIKKLLRLSLKVENKLWEAVRLTTNTKLSNKSNKKLYEILKDFFNAYASFTAIYRFTRPSFYQRFIDGLKNKIPDPKEKNIIFLLKNEFYRLNFVPSNSLKQSATLLKRVGKRRFKMHNGYLDSFIRGRRLFKEIARRLKIKDVEVQNCTLEEIREYLINNKDVPREEIDNRIKYFKFLYHDGFFEITIKPEKSKEKIAENMDYTTIKGTPAYPGLIFGTARVIRESLGKISAQELKKIKKGEILITTSTSPDMMSAIVKAKAIVTDVGGLLSHAAIVSRELKKPCIIGTKIATKVLKDGDLVEVDANKGVVKILKK